MSASMMTSWDFPPAIPHLVARSDWTAHYAATMLLMWWIMMIAMMTPSASPMILLYARVVRNSQTKSTSYRAPDPTTELLKKSITFVPTAFFAAGYLIAWLAFSVAAVFLQWVLEFAGLVDGMKMWSTNYAFSGVLLVLAGIYQLTPFKAACLKHCQSPAWFISNHWRQGSLGAWRMGTIHGFYCVGCCWSLMLLLFVGGAMNLVWIAGLAIIVLLEKTFRFSVFIVRLAAFLLIAAGGFLLIGSALQ